MAILDCRDTRITLWAGGNAQHSPGFVLWDKNAYQFGEAAREQARLRPRDSNTRFWWQLGTQPLQPSLGPARHTADLVHAHLTDIHKASGAPDGIALAVPDSMPREQLSLLLGVAQTCSFTVTGLVSRSVLLASSSSLIANHSRVLHVETQLNQTVANELSIDGDRVTLTRSTPLPSCGLLALQERCVVAIASAFIQQTRYDPRRAAASEQQLYNMLPEVLGEIASKGEASVDIDGNRCRVTATVLASVCDRLLSGLASARGDESTPVLIDPELQSLPGIQSLSGEVAALAADHLWSSWEQQRDHVKAASDDLHLIDKLPSRVEAQTPVDKAPLEEPPVATKADSPAASAPIASTGPKATHVLLGTKAMPLHGDKVELGGAFALRISNGQWSLHGEGGLINGLPSSPAQGLELGDTLSLGSTGHGRLIEVVD